MIENGRIALGPVDGNWNLYFPYTVSNFAIDGLTAVKCKGKYLMFDVLSVRNIGKGTLMRLALFGTNTFE